MQVRTFLDSDVNLGETHILIVIIGQYHYSTDGQTIQCNVSADLRMSEGSINSTMLSLDIQPKQTMAQVRLLLPVPVCNKIWEVFG